MGFKKVVKRISALGIGASMVGATIFGAFAQADLAQYPNQYIKDGKFTGVLVVGDQAAAADVIGVSDIAVSLQFAATKPVSVSAAGAVTVTGDAWKVGTSTKILELSEEVSTGTNIETLRNITTFIDSGDLGVLASGTVSNSKGDAPYNQYLYLLGPGTGVSSGYVVYTESDDDVTADFLYFKSGQEIGRYLLEFTTALESDVDDSAGTATSTGTYLTDIEDIDITMMGKSYTIVQARRTSSTGSNVKLILMGGAVRDSMLEGNTKTYTIDGEDFEVSVDYVDSNSAKLTVNGEGTRDMLDGDTDKMSDGTVVGISEILYQDYAGGVHQVTFFLGAQKLEIKDTLITNIDQDSGSLKIDDNTINGGFVIVEGTDDNSTFKINRIHVNMTADDDLYVPAGGKLSENPDLDEPEVIFTSNWDYEYRGLADQTSEKVEVSTSGSKKYKLKFQDGDGEDVSLPLVEAMAASILEFGEKDKALINNENRSITKDDYIILTDESENRGERKTYVLQYKGAEKSTADSPVVKFKDLGDGDTIEQSYAIPSSAETIVGPAGSPVWKIATLKIGGADFNVYNNSVATSNDFSIIVDLNAQNSIDVISKTVNITTNSGLEIGVQNGTNPTSNGVIVTFKTPDDGRDGASTQDNVETLQATDFAVNVTADSNGKVDLAELTGYTNAQKGVRLSLRTPDDETDVAYGYTSYGAFIRHETPTSDPNTITIDYPAAQREAMVYVTGMGAGFAQTAATTTGAVTVQRIDVGATKLASEVPNVNAVSSILVGGPCANAAAASVMGNPADCTAGFTPGVGLVQMYSVGGGNVAMLVAGYSAGDTRNAAAVVANYQDYGLTGMKMEVKKVNNQLTVATSTG